MWGVLRGYAVTNNIPIIRGWGKSPHDGRMAVVSWESLVNKGYHPQMAELFKSVNL